MPYNIKKIQVSKNLLHSLKEPGTSIFSQIQTFAKYGYDKEVVFSQYMIFRNCKDKNFARSGIKELEDRGVIKKIEKTYYSISTEIMNPKNNYVMIDYQEYLKAKDLKVLRHYLILIDNIFRDLGFGNRPISYFAELEEVSESTIIRYNKKLREAGLVYFYRPTYNEKTGKNDILKYTLTNKVEGAIHDANWRRSVTSKYNRFCKNPAAYSPDQIKELKLLCEQYNLEQPNKNRHKDLQVFK